MTQGRDCRTGVRSQVRIRRKRRERRQSVSAIIIKRADVFSCIPSLPLLSLSSSPASLLHFCCIPACLFTLPSLSPSFLAVCLSRNTTHRFTRPSLPCRSRLAALSPHCVAVVVSHALCFPLHPFTFHSSLDMVTSLQTNHDRCSVSHCHAAPCADGAAAARCVCRAVLVLCCTPLFAPLLCSLRLFPFSVLLRCLRRPSTLR
jgi:hypothetical protein